MPEQTQPVVEGTPAGADPATTEASADTAMTSSAAKPEVKKNNLKIILIVAGVALVALMLILVAAYFLFFNGGALNNTASSGSYSASDPAKLSQQLNEDFTKSLSDATQLEAAFSNPFSAIDNSLTTDMIGKGEHVDMTITMDMESESVASNVSLSLSADTAYLADGLNMDAEFTFDMSNSGLSITQSGQIKFVDNDLYMQLDDGLVTSSLGLPSGWLRIQEEEISSVYDTTGVETLDESELEEIEQKLEELNQTEGDLITNATSAESKTIAGVEVPCMQADVNSSYVNALLSETEVDITYEFGPLLVCVDGNDKPAFFSVTVTVISDGEGVDMAIEATTEPLAEAPAIEVPAESEVTNLSEYTGGTVSSNVDNSSTDSGETTASSPAARINSANDSQTRANTTAVATAIHLYVVDNGGEFPTANGESLKLITEDTLLDMGVYFSELEGIVPNYISADVTSATGDPIYVGRFSNTEIIVGSVLTSGQLYTVIK